MVLDVAIIGAGAAGVAAARELQAAGLHLVVLEARDRIGGRIFTERDNRIGVPIELGAELIHGRAEAVQDVIDEQSLHAVEIEGGRWRSRRGSLSPAPDFWEQLDSVMERLPRRPRHDYSFSDFMRQRPGGRPLAEARRLALQYVEGFHAADPALVSGTVLADAGSPGNDVRERRLGRIIDGYDRVIEWLAQPVTRYVHLSSIVTAVHWRRGEVELHTRHAGTGRTTTLRARAAIVTVPVGVLQAKDGQRGAIGFVPALDTKREALGRVAMGAVIRLVFQLRERFWAEAWFAAHTRKRDLDTLSFLHSDAPDFAVWWTSYPMRTPLMVGWCGGPRAHALRQLDHAALESRAIASLARALRLSTRRVRAQVIRSWMHDWQADPFTRGAYSYQLVGGIDVPAALARPIRQTLFFAGEATDTEGATGTVHGAIATGRRAAKQVLRALL